LSRVDGLADEDIDYSDIPSLDEEFLARAARVPWPPAKRQLTIRLDEDVLAWLKSLGKGYQTRINRILRIAMATGRPRRSVPRKRVPAALAAPATRKRRAT
jgi:uncharacterized protein (DUF4415 family)